MAESSRPSIAEAYRFARSMMGLGRVGRVALPKKREMKKLAEGILSGEV
jgi:hypothetical protein